MKSPFGLMLMLTMACSIGYAQQNKKAITTNNPLFIDIHYLPSGKVNFKDVGDAHAKDLATQSKYDVQFIKYWVDESQGIVYCLSTAPDTAAITKTHQQAHGLLPQTILEVKDGHAADAKGNKNFYLDVHELGEGKVTAADVEKAHQKDLAVQDKYGVRFINYWVDEKKGTVMCLSQASDSLKVIETHREAHGLVPVRVEKVLQGQ